MNLSCLAPRVSTALAVISLAISSVDTTHAQFVPYGNAYQGQPQYQPHQAYAPQYNTVAYNSGQQFMAGPQVARPQQFSQPQYGARSQYPTQPQYVAYAQQPAIENMPSITQPAETIPPGPMPRQSTQMAPHAAAPEYSQHGGYESYSTNGNGGAGYSCEGYGYGNYSQGNYCCDSYGSCNTCCAPCAPRRHWFGGIYGLLMERVECTNTPIVYQTTMPGTGHYPTYDEVVMSYGDLDGDVQPGFEVRFGATFACCGGPGGYGGCYDPCGGCNSGCCGTLGWEVGYWMLDEESTTAYVSDVVGGPTFTHGMKRFDRLEHYYDGVWRPLNHFYSYGVPTQDYWTAWGNIAPQITYAVARSSFQAQNVEWNLVCLPTISGGSCGASACDSCSGGSCYGGGCDNYGSGCCGSGGCGHVGGSCGAYCYCGPRWQCTSSLGVRYFRFDDDYMFQADWEMYDYAGGVTTGDTGSLAYYSDLNNQLVGFQFGGSGCYHLGLCGRVALHLGANAGIYGNYIEMNQYFNGQVRDMGDLMPYNVMAEDENISFLGELRLGASYQCTCNCRVYGGYRAFGVTGVAVNYNQQPSPTDMPYINCDGSLFLHGVQTGVEFMY